MRDHFVSWTGSWYTADNLVLSVAGNTTHAQVVGLASRYFTGNGSNTGLRFRPIEGDLPAQRLAYDERPLAQSNLALGMPGLSRSDPDRYILMILNSLLGRGMSSRLFKEVRERRGLAYAVGSSMHRHADTGAFAVNAGVSPEHLEEAVQVIIEELEKLTREPVGEDELTKARDYTIGSFRLSLESSMSLAQRAGEALLTMGEIESVDSVVSRLAAVTTEDIQRVAGQIFKREKMTLSVVGPSIEEARLLALLAA
jgi:predicted Zn-dependent peptidase